MPSMLIGRPQKLRGFDDFNRANSTNLGPDWIEFTGNKTITSNALANTGGALWSTPCFTDDEYSEVVLSSTNGPLQLLVRGTSTGWPLVIVEITPTSGAWTVLTDPTSGTANHTNRKSGTMSACPIGTRLRFDAVGPTYGIYRDGVFIDSWVDSGYAVQALAPSRRYVGVNLGGNFDEWSGGDL